MTYVRSDFGASRKLKIVMKVFVGVLILVRVSCGCSAQIERPTFGPPLDKPDMAKMFRWFDGLDFDAVHTGQFVRLRWRGRG